MATSAKKRFVVDPREARWTGEQRRAFGRVLHEVEFVDGERRGEKIWVRQPPPRIAGPAARRSVKRDQKILEAAVARDLVALAEPDAEADDYPADPLPATTRMPRVGDVLRRVFRNQDIAVRVVDRDGRVGYEAEDVVYRSLTAAAEHYTKYKVSGPVFWGLR